MEAYSGSHYWAKVFADLGHEVRLISPQFVTPYAKSNKNDRNDAEATCEAVGRPSMRFVPVKSAEQLEVAGSMYYSTQWRPDQPERSLLAPVAGSLVMCVDGRY